MTRLMSFLSCKGIFFTVESAMLIRFFFESIISYYNYPIPKNQLKNISC
jgi:hypothetical protein